MTAATAGVAKPLFAAKSYDRLLGLEGFSEALLKNHFTLYQGYVANAGKVYDRLADLSAKGETSTPEYAELKRRFGWEFNGVRLHELYFDNLAKGGRPASEGLGVVRKLKAQFGGLDAWEKDFRATGALRGIGWAILYLDRTEGRLFNAWVNEHDTGHLAGCAPLLVLDVFEHAFMLDYGLKRADYISAFFKSLDWQAVEERSRKG